MAITSKKITAEITVSGSSQSATTESILGRIDQVIIQSTIENQSIDFILQNHTGLEMYRKEGLFLYSGEGNKTSIFDLRPNILPQGPVTILIENPTTQSDTITVTIIEKERES